MYIHSFNCSLWVEMTELTTGVLCYVLSLHDAMCKLSVPNLLTPYPDYACNKRTWSLHCTYRHYVQNFAIGISRVKHISVTAFADCTTARNHSIQGHCVISEVISEVRVKQPESIVSLVPCNCQADKGSIWVEEAVAACSQCQVFTHWPSPS